jgi:hypothetical protein
MPEAACTPPLAFRCELSSVTYFSPASPQFVGAEADARPLEHLGVGVEGFTAPDAGHRRALRARGGA